MPLISFDTPWKHQKPEVFWCFQEVSKEISGMKWVKVFCFGKKSCRLQTSDKYQPLFDSSKEYWRNFFPGIWYVFVKDTPYYLAAMNGTSSTIGCMKANSSKFAFENCSIMIQVKYLVFSVKWTSLGLVSKFNTSSGVCFDFCF